MRHKETGQAVLIVVLVLVIALTVGLSVASRTITNLRLSTEEENSQRAFSAAEAGIEAALKSSCTTGVCNIGNDANPFSNNAAFTGTITKIDGDEFLLRGGNLISAYDGADIWLSDYSPDPKNLYTNPFEGTLTIYWGSSDDGCNEPAIELITISGDRFNPTLTRYAVDACADRRLRNNFCPSGYAGCPTLQILPPNTKKAGKEFHFAVTTTLTAGSKGLLARVVPLYKSGYIGVTGAGVNGATLPLQGKLIESVGTSQTTQRKIVFFQSNPELPSEFFQYLLFIPKKP
ncbi:MAG: hypothetical protein HYT10_02145 [Candidatus Levybacteria bacterium]|nr:hypothetical protein [Candidatus Levybacteria bacterium]